MFVNEIVTEFKVRAAIDELYFFRVSRNDETFGQECVT